MDKQDNITATYNLENAKSTGPYKLEKKGKALPQVDQNVTPSLVPHPLRSMVMNKEDGY